MQINSVFLLLINFHKFITDDGSEFCTTILKEENRGLIMINHRYRS